ncbi:MAG TPA: PfkB family carbohydrate kinase [Syntrophales bacterium]|nr:PfkB family carbohydrate kinase [Syntrophales bacterium]
MRRKATSPQHRVFGLGQCSLDALGRIAAYPPPDVKCEFSGLTVQGGGPVATALAALSRWGVACTFAGVVGDDTAGDAIRASLLAEGIDTAGLVTRPGALSQQAFIFAEPARKGRRTIFWQRPTGDPLRPEEVDLERLLRAHAFHTDGLFIESALFAADEARKAGIPVVVDAGTLREGMLDLARRSDCFIASETFGRALAGDDFPGEALKRMAALGPGLVAVTLGAEGYAALLDGRIVRKPAWPARAVDTTGCGDVFHAGFVYGLLNGWEHARSLDFGAWAAARVSRRLGGREGIPTLRQVRAAGYR